MIPMQRLERDSNPRPSKGINGPYKCATTPRSSNNNNDDDDDNT